MREDGVESSVIANEDLWCNPCECEFCFEEWGNSTLENLLSAGKPDTIKLKYIPESLEVCLDEGSGSRKYSWGGFEVCLPARTVSSLLYEWGGPVNGTVYSLENPVVIKEYDQPDCDIDDLTDSSPETLRCRVRVQSISSVWTLNIRVWFWTSGNFYLLFNHDMPLTGADGFWKYNATSTWANQITQATSYPTSGLVGQADGTVELTICCDDTCSSTPDTGMPANVTVSISDEARDCIWSDPNVCTSPPDPENVNCLALDSGPWTVPQFSPTFYTVTVPGNTMGDDCPQDVLCASFDIDITWWGNNSEDLTSQPGFCWRLEGIFGFSFWSDSLYGDYYHIPGQTDIPGGTEVADACLTALGQVPIFTVSP